MEHVYLIVALLVAGLYVSPAVAQPADLHGTVVEANGETVRVELADTITVELSAEGRVIQERTIRGTVRQIRIALLEVVRVEQTLEGPWVAVGWVTRSELEPAVGNTVEFTSFQPRPATLIIQSDPEGGDAYVDGRQVGPTPARAKVMPGAHKVRVESECYQPTTREVNVGAGQRREVMARLVSRPIRGGRFGPAQVITSSADGAESAEAADLDGDGDLDVVAASFRDDTVAWFENTGGGSFGPAQVITSSADGAESAEAADLDGDGDLDVVAASLLDDTVAWYENTVGGSFGPAQVITTSGDGLLSASAADLDGDGDLDVVAASLLDNTVAWYENQQGNCGQNR